AGRARGGDRPPALAQGVRPDREDPARSWSPRRTNRRRLPGDLRGWQGSTLRRPRDRRQGGRISARRSSPPGRAPAHSALGEPRSSRAVRKRRSRCARGFRQARMRAAHGARRRIWQRAAGVRRALHRRTADRAAPDRPPVDGRRVVCRSPRRHARRRAGRSMSAIELRGVTKGYPPREPGLPAQELLRGVDLTVQRGEFVAVEGQSGSGKSTLLHLLGGLDREFDGTAHVLGCDLRAVTDAELAALRHTQIGFVFQSFNLLPSLSALENVLLPDFFGDGVPDAERRAREALERVGLADKERARPVALSGGERQRVAIARELGALAVSAGGVALGTGCLVFFLALGTGLQDVVHDVFPVSTREVEVVVPQLAIGSLLGEQKIDEATVRRLRAVRGVAAVYPKMQLRIPAVSRYNGTFFGREMRVGL